MKLFPTLCTLSMERSGKRYGIFHDKKASKETVTVHKKGFDSFLAVEERLFSFTPRYIRRRMSYGLFIRRDNIVATDAASGLPCLNRIFFLSFYFLAVN